jgi:hypothetical protein
MHRWALLNGQPHFFQVSRIVCTDGHQLVRADEWRQQGGIASGNGARLPRRRPPNRLAVIAHFSSLATAMTAAGTTVPCSDGIAG